WLAHRLGDAEVDHLEHRFVVAIANEHVRRLQIAMDDPLLMSMLHRLAGTEEKIESLLQRQVMLVAIASDRYPLNQFHDEIRSAGRGRPAVMHLGDIRMIHDRERLPLSFETSDDLPRVHAGLEHLEGNLAADWLGLLGEEDDAEAAFADVLEELVRTDDRSWA